MVSIPIRARGDLPDADKAKIAHASGSYTLKDLARRIVDALNPDLITPSPPSGGEGGGEGAALQARINAIKPLHDPKLRNLILALKQQNEQIIDSVTQDAVLEAGFSEAARERAQKIVTSFEQFIVQHKDEITALQILYNRPTKAPLKFEDLKQLAESLQAPPRLWTESQLWQAYAALDKNKVKGASARRILTDLVSLVRFAMHQDNELVPYPERVAANFKAWLAQQQSSPSPASAGEGRGEGSRFSAEQVKWLRMIADHIAANLGIEIDDFEYVPFNKDGGIGKVHQLFGRELPALLVAINGALAA